MAEISEGPCYFGPMYEFPGDDIVELLPGSYTLDTARGKGLTIVWSDYFGIHHKVDFSSPNGPKVIEVWFPVDGSIQKTAATLVGMKWDWMQDDTYGPGKFEYTKWEWLEGEKHRPWRFGFNKNCRWVQAKFLKQKEQNRDPIIRIECSGYRLRNIDFALGTEIRKYYRGTTEISNNISKAVKTGANNVD